MNSRLLLLVLIGISVASLMMPSIVKAQTDAPDIAAWLTQHSLVSESIRWQDANGIKTYSDWSATQKTDLLEMYQKVWKGEPLGLTDPPPNMIDLADDEYTLTVLSKDHAWPLFLAHVAHSLAVETGKWVSWSLTEYSQEELLELFDGSRIFRWDRDHGGYKLIYRGIPAPPDFSFEFLNKYNMIAQDRLRTIGNLLDWCRSNMKHFNGGFTAENAENHWQYRGATPISRVISGTMFHSSFWNTEFFSHHTGGCWGTTAFLREVLRVVNIPVKNAPARRHALPYFMSDDKYLSHGDDPYNWNTKNIPFPIEELFINQRTYDAWFGSKVPQKVNNVGRRTEVLAIKYLHPPMYWVNRDKGTLHRLIGAAVEPFIPSVQNATSLTVDVQSGKIYWTEKTSNTTGSIRRANLDGTNIEEIKSLTGVPYSIAIDPTNSKIYLTNSSGKIQRLSVDGSNFQGNLITGLEFPRNINVAFGRIYWTEGTNQIRRANLNGSGVETIATSSGALHGILVQDHRVYWTEQTGENRGKIRRAHLNGTNSETVAVLSDVPINIGMDTMHYDFNGHQILLYWTTSSGKVQRANRDGKNKRTVATGLIAPDHFVLGANIPRTVVPEFLRPAMYWVDTQAGTLHRLIGSVVEPFIPSVQNVTSLAVDVASSKVYWTQKTSNDTGKIQRANFNGTNVEEVKSLTGIPHDIGIDTVNNRIYLTNSQGKVQRINTDGSSFQPNLITGLASPKEIALDVIGGKVYWTEKSGRIRQANLNGSNIQTFANNFGTIGDIVVAGKNLYWTLSVNEYDNYIIRSSLKNKKIERLGGSFIRPLVGIAVDTADNRVYWSDVLGQIRRAYLPGLIGKGTQRYIPLEGKNLITGLNAPGSLALGRDISNLPVLEYQHRAIYWSDNINRTLHRFTGEGVENFLPSVQNATSITMDVEKNKLYWTEKTGDHSGRIQRVNLDGSNVEQVRALKSAPLHITLDTANEKLYLINSWRKIQRLNYDGSNYENNLITRLNSPKGMIVDGLGEKLYWIEKTSNTTGSVKKANLDGTNVEQVISVEGIPTSIAIDTMNHKLYLTNSLGKVQRLDFDGHNFETDLITDLDSPLAVAIDLVRKKIVWAEMGKINSADLNGENLQTVVAGLGTPVNLNLLETGQTNVSIAAAPTKLIVPTDVTHLYPDYPNPFNPETWIPYQLSKRADVTLRIYSVNGVLVRTLSLGHRSAGIYQSRSHAAYWDGRNMQGEPVASGVYFYTLTAGDFSATRKMLIRK